MLYMIEIQSAASNAIRPQPTSSRVSRGVTEAMQQQIKSAVHMELINRLDLDKLSEIQETPNGKRQLFTLIQQLLNEQGIPLSGIERDRIAQEVLDKHFSRKHGPHAYYGQK